MPNSDWPSRRAILNALASVVTPFGDHGRIRPPVAAPDVAVVCQDGAETRLPHVLSGHASALQMMFTRCESTCPMQGAIFERVQKTIPDMATRKLQLVSLSIDPANDTPRAMSDWLRRFHAGQAWIGAAPAKKDLTQVKDFFGRGITPTDDHSTQVHILDRQGRLIWRTIELPSAEEISAIMMRL